MPLHGEVVLDLRRLDALGPGRPAGRAGDRAGRGDDRAAAGARRGGGLGVRRRPRVARRRDRRRNDRDQRRRRARAALRLDAPPGGRHRGGARRRTCPPPPRRPREGQHRLRPRRAALRERGHARRDHRRPAAAGAASHVTWSSRCSPSTTSMPRSTRSGRCGATSTRAQAVELFFQDGLDLVCDRLRSRPALRPAPRRVRAGGGGRARRSDRRARRGRRGAAGRRRRRGRADDAHGAGAVALPRGAHRGDQPRSARPTSSTSRSRPIGSREFVREVADGWPRSRRTQPCGCSATRPTATFT